MPRKLWGEFIDTSLDKYSDSDKYIPISLKRAKLDEVQNSGPVPEEKNVKIKMKSSLVTQTIEVMKQTEMLQSLIDTYSNKSGSSNYLLNPCQIIPEVNFPPENAEDFISDDKFAKPIWFVPPLNTPFSQGVPQHYPEITPTICRASLRKAVSGQLSVAGFTDTAESALILFADAVEEFMRNFMQQIRDVHANNPKLELSNEIEISTLEKAYYAYTNTSLTQVHNYFKHNLVARNRSEIAEFKGVLQEYDKLMKESQSMQKEDFQESDFLNILEMPQTSNTADITVNNSTLQNVQGSTGGILNVLDGQVQLPVQLEAANMHEQGAAEQLNTYSTDVFLQSHE